MIRRSRSLLLAAILMSPLLPLVAAAADPTPTQTPANADSDTPATPARPGRAGMSGAVEEATSDDSDFLNQTAKDLGIAPPGQRMDRQILNWFGLRPQLSNSGISVEGALVGDFSKNFEGGVDTASEASRYLLDMRINLDTRAAFGLYGGTFSIDFQQQGGRNGSDILTGDVQGYANADADGRTQIAEIWYEQLMLDNRVRIKVGKVDANSEFAVPSYGGDFINSSYGHSPTLNPWMPTYPDPATSFNLFLTPVRWFFVSAGVYDGSGAGQGLATGSYGPSKLFHSDSSLFYIGETGVRWVFADNTLPGRAMIGGHYHDADFERFNGGTQAGSAGMYAILEQKLVHPRYYDKGYEGGVYAFLQYGHADGKVSEVTDHVGVGLTWVGPYQKTYLDSLGIGFTSARLSDAAGAGFTEDWETSFELFYNYQATNYLSIKPDLQYIIHPGGDETLSDALVATLRVTLAF